MSDQTVIIGAGIIGLAAAAYLQDAGGQVTLVDRRGVAREASFANAGALAFSDILPLASPGMLRDAPLWLLDPLGPLSIPPAYGPRILPWLIRFARASLPDRVRRNTAAQSALMDLARAETGPLLARAGAASMVRSDGCLELYESEAEFRQSEKGWAARERHGIGFEHVRGARLAALQPGLAPRFPVGTFVAEWQTVSDPYQLACALFEHIRQRGGTLVEAAVDRVVPDGAGAAVHLADGRVIACARAVIAAGAWSKPLAAALGDRIPLETERGYNTTLPADAFPVRRQLVFGGHGFVVTPLATGLRIGGAVELGGLARPPNYARADVMLKKTAAFLPGLKTEGGEQWMGFRPSLPDTLPVIGRARATQAVLYAFGHGHLGLTQAAATGRLVADLAMGRPPAIDVTPFRPDRF